MGEFAGMFGCSVIPVPAVPLFPRFPVFLGGKHTPWYEKSNIKLPKDSVLEGSGRKENPVMLFSIVEPFSGFGCFGLTQELYGYDVRNSYDVTNLHCSVQRRF